MSTSSESLGEVHGSVITNGKVGWRRILSFFGPAYMVSVGYMDPGNWATDLAAGSQFGYKLIWVLLLSNLVALLLQSLATRLGIVQGLDLAQASRQHYNRFVNFCLFILAQIAIIACDLAEVIGMAIGLQLLFHLPLLWGVALTMSDTILLLFLLNKGMRHLEGFIISMVFIVGLSFLVEMFIVEPDIKQVGLGLIPHNLNGSALYIAIGIIGATVMPHNLYLHSSLVQTRKIERNEIGIRESIKMNLLDTTIALNLAFFVNAAILILAAAAFFRYGFHQVAEIQDAHKLLQHIFGSLAPALFAIALIAAGQSSTVTGTLAGQIIMEGHINLRIQPWLRRMITRLLAIIPAFFTILYAGGQALGNLLIFSQVVLSLQLGFAVIPLIHFTSDKEKMGSFANTTRIKVLAWLTAVLIVGLNVKLVVEQIADWAKGSPNQQTLIYFTTIPLAIAIVLLLLYVFLKPFFIKSENKHSKVPHGSALEIEAIAPVNLTRIGIAVDFSAHDRDTIRHALMQGGKTAEYYLIHVVETAGAQYLGEAVNDYETQSDKENLEKYQLRLKELGYHSHNSVGFGKVAQAIAQVVNKQNLELLVMGAHGHKAFKDIIFGTTVDSVRHLIKVPVLIVQ
ncbi:Nramp family divalent metal transporter [Mucilaginibacter arboris]|uniref:Divalent metal cation transporter MntH n=1 Tax=Mucilaginibacter arboris TaxID=2682090 RepID=A0A7K1T195_9SPHI|nr:Nramp family divalent metal transporter [Mucilaginibacter arboris]MVN23352.1 Mn(2+) uptake NRAMP transporter MntH [Mucilaginibacter arboris]